MPDIIEKTVHTLGEEAAQMESALVQELAPVRKSNRGGRREGSGIKKGQKTLKTLKKEAIRSIITDYVEARLEPILESLYTRVLKDGDPSAAKLLLEHGAGKPVSTLEMDKRGAHPVLILDLM